MLTIEGVYNSQPTNTDWIKGFSEQSMFACLTESKMLQSDKDSAEFIKVCESYSHPQVTNNRTVGEIAHVLVRRAGKNTYVFIFGERMEPFNANEYQLDELKIKEHSEFLRDIKLIKDAKAASKY